MSAAAKVGADVAGGCVSGVDWASAGIGRRTTSRSRVSERMIMRPSAGLERWPFESAAFEERGALLFAIAVAIHNGEDARTAGGAGAPERAAGVGAVFADDVVLHVEEPDFSHVAVVVANDAAEGFDAGFHGRAALAHKFDNGMGAGDFDVFFAGASGTRGAYVLIGVASGAEDG